MNILLIIIACFICVIGLSFFAFYLLELECKSCNEKTLKIEKVTFDDGRELYYIRHKTRLFWIGPYIWEYYQELYDSFTWFRSLGDTFVTYEDAKKEYDRIIKYSSKIVKTEIL